MDKAYRGWQQQPGERLDYRPEGKANGLTTPPDSLEDRISDFQARQLQAGDAAMDVTRTLWPVCPQDFTRMVLAHPGAHLGSAMQSTQGFRHRGMSWLCVPHPWTCVLCAHPPEPSDG